MCVQFITPYDYFDSPILVSLGSESSTSQFRQLVLFNLISYTNENMPFSGGSGLVAKSCLTLVTPCQAPLSMGFSRQEYCSGLPFPSPGDLLNPGTKPFAYSPFLDDKKAFESKECLIFNSVFCQGSSTVCLKGCFVLQWANYFTLFKKNQYQRINWFFFIYLNCKNHCQMVTKMKQTKNISKTPDFVFLTEESFPVIISSLENTLLDCDCLENFPCFSSKNSHYDFSGKAAGVGCYLF